MAKITGSFKSKCVMCENPLKVGDDAYFIFATAPLDFYHSRHQTEYWTKHNENRRGELLEHDIEPKTTPTKEKGFLCSECWDECKRLVGK